MESTSISRRKFLAAGGGITFAIAGYPLLSGLSGPSKTYKTEQVTAWVHLSNSGKVTIYNPASEMGQGSMTALAVLVAEEMDADWDQVMIEYSPVEPSVYGRGWGRGRNRGGTMLTVGSYSVRGYFENLRHAGAQVRHVLRHSAAGHWGVPIEEVTTSPGQVHHPKTGRSAGYGEVVDFISVPDPIPEIPAESLKKPTAFRIIGSNTPRYDIPAKSDGSAMYAMDVRLPGMVYAVMTRSPVFGSRPSLNNRSEILARENVLDVVTMDHGVAVVAQRIHDAMEARKKMDISWSEDVTGISHTSSTAMEEYERIAGDDQAGWEVLNSSGDTSGALAGADRIYSFDYRNDYVYHAQMEPLNAVVALAEDGNSAEVWVGSQSHDGARSTAAEVLALDFSKINLHPHFLGGGFGRRSMSDYVAEAAAIAKQVKKPVKLIWTREDDVRYGAFRPMSLQRMRATVNGEGIIDTWSHRIVGTGDGLLASGAGTNFYSFDNQQIELKSIDHGIRTKHWRAVGHGPNKFAIESLIDEVSADQGIDPYQMRRQLMRNHPRARKVLETAKGMADNAGKVPAGRARGLGFGERSEALVAGVCEVSLDRDSGKISVHRVWAALDAGLVVQPDNAIAQMEGAINMGLSSVLMERITFVNGQVQQSNFHDYPILRMSEAPESIEIEIIPSDEPPAGIGEAGLPWIGSAVAQAVYALTGKRLRDMPFTPDRVKEVLA